MSERPDPPTDAEELVDLLDDLFEQRIPPYQPGRPRGGAPEDAP